MFDSAMIKQLKQSNISVDGEKTKTRVQELWRSAKPDVKKSVSELAGISNSAIYRNITTGSISAKMAIALGQVLNADPFYLIGEADERGEYSDEVVVKLLKKLGKYDKLLGEQKKAQRKPRTAKAVKKSSQPKSDKEIDDEVKARFEKELEAAIKETRDEYIAKKASGEVDQADRASIRSMSDDDIMLMIRTLKLKAGVGVQSAKDALSKIDDILLV